MLDDKTQCSWPADTVMKIASLLVIIALAKGASPLPERCSTLPKEPEWKCNRSSRIWFYNSTIRNCQDRVVDYCTTEEELLKQFFIVEQECKAACRDPQLGVCATYPDERICGLLQPMHRFNPDKSRCEWFDYGDCGDKRGLFETKEKCTKECGKFSRDPCVQPLNEGSWCFSEKNLSMPVFWFNAKTERCEEFFYKGCGGNGNNFIDPKECWETCKGHVKNPCNFPINGGHESCRSRTPGRFYGYNFYNKRCESFGYFGCGGYSNRFHTAKECWTNCTNVSTLAFPTKKCLLPGLGHRYRTFKRHFYNIESNTCESSSYWLLDKEKNRFDSFEDCETTCKANFTGYPPYPISGKH